MCGQKAIDVFHRSKLSKVELAKSWVNNLLVDGQRFFLPKHHNATDKRRIGYLAQINKALHDFKIPRQYLAIAVDKKRHQLFAYDVLCGDVIAISQIEHVQLNAKAIRNIEASRAKGTVFEYVEFHGDAFFWTIRVILDGCAGEILRLPLGKSLLISFHWPLSQARSLN